MFFKNITTYVPDSPEELNFMFDFLETSEIGQEIILEDFLVQECSGAQTKTIGWTKPLPDDVGDSTSYVHRLDGCTMMCLKSYEKVVPASAVKEELKKRVHDYNIKSERPLSKKEISAMRYDVIARLSAEALSRSYTTHGYFDRSGYLVVDSGSPTRCKEFVDLLTETLIEVQGGLENFTPVNFKLLAWPELTGKLTSMVSNMQKIAINPPLQVGYYAAFESEGSKLVYTEDEARIDHTKISRVVLEDAFVVTDLELSFNDTLSFILNTDSILKKLRFSDSLIDIGVEESSEDKMASFDSDYSIMVGTIRGLLKHLDGLLT